MDQVDGIWLHNSSNNSISPPTLHRDTNITIVKTGEVPRTKNIWILKCVKFPDHFIRFLIPITENLLNKG
jgi:hypothetical protein